MNELSFNEKFDLLEIQKESLYKEFNEPAFIDVKIMQCYIINDDWERIYFDNTF